MNAKKLIFTTMFASTIISFLCSCRTLSRKESSPGQGNENFYPKISHLPILVIKEKDKSIQTKDKVNVDLKFIGLKSDSMANVDQVADFETFARMKIRGSSSALLPKKQYSLEFTEKDYKSSRDLEIFGWPKDSDYVLQGPYLDKTLMRNKLVYDISREMGHYAPKIEYMEVYRFHKDGAKEYMGLYYFMEKIKRSSGRVDIKKAPKEGEKNQSGGYILKIDRADPDEVTIKTKSQRYVLVYPKAEKTSAEHKAYLQDFLSKVDSALQSKDYERLKKLVDIESFVDFCLLQEWGKNVDGYLFSNFLHKDRDGKLVAGPIWDFNLTFGNASHRSGYFSEGWRFEGEQVSSIYKRLLNLAPFRKSMRTRWQQLRTDLFSDEKLSLRIDQTRQQIGEAADRDQTRWLTLGHRLKYAPNKGAKNYKSVIVDFKNWVLTRAKWLDENL